MLRAKLIKEAAAFGLGGGELRFQPVAQGQQLIGFDDDTGSGVTSRLSLDLVQSV